MQLRTDLAIENTETDRNLRGIEQETVMKGKLKITRIAVTSEETGELIGKPVGQYVTVESLPMTDYYRDIREETEIIGEEIRKFLPERGDILVIGLGNKEITPDAIGTESMKYILATRHIKGEWARTAGLEKLRGASVITPGVMGQTGIEVSEIVMSVAGKIKPKAVIAVDALAARELSRLGCTVQISNTGIFPGSGVGNHRKGITEETIGIPVIAVGIPTVVDAVTLAQDILQRETIDESKVSPRGAGMIVTPREIDLLTERASRLIGMSINIALQREYDFETLSALVS